MCSRWWGDRGVRYLPRWAGAEPEGGGTAATQPTMTAPAIDYAGVRYSSMKEEHR